MKLPANDPVTWNQEIDEVPAPGRGRICLNGWWRFAPAPAPDVGTPDYGWIRVPGSWAPSTSWQGCDQSEVIVHPHWEGWGEGKSVWRGWYERPLLIPAPWQGRSVSLVCERISTDAQVYCDDQLVGVIGWPRGSLDLTPFVRPGREHRLRVVVSVVPEEGDVKQYMATATSQVIMSKAEIYARGLIGDVLLESKPKGACIESVFYKPSVRNGTIQVEIDLKHVKEPGLVSVVAEMCTLDGKVEKRFEAKVEVTKGESQTVKCEWPWVNARKWDLDQPELYRGVVTVTGSQVKDSYSDEFGFREFWIEGRDFYLNGTVIHLRPTLMPQHGMLEAIGGEITIWRDRGRNIVEIWPNDMRERTRWSTEDWLLTESDRRGFLVMANSPHIAPFVERWHEPATRAVYEQYVREEVMRIRNHPSAVIYVTTGNYFGHDLEQDPRHIGRRGWADSEAGWKTRAQIGEEALDSVRKMDPTRVVCTHNGSYVGDFQTSNTYLNLIPLQEREDWLSMWSKKGEIPFMAVEFETPVNLTVRRGRHSHIGANTSEPLVTEYCAGYVGRAAWELEDDAYRAGIFAKWRPDEKSWWYGQPRIHAQANFQNLLVKNIKSLWPSWRGYGISGGMIAWEQGHGYGDPLVGEVLTSRFKPGLRGVWHPTLPKALSDPSAIPKLPAGVAMESVNGDTLVWIAGAQSEVNPLDDEGLLAEFTTKDHTFQVGETFSKNIMSINDTRKIHVLKVNWQVSVDGTQIDHGVIERPMKVGEIAGSPVAVVLPEKITQKAVSGMMTIHASLAGHESTDSFAFRVMSKDPPGWIKCFVEDPSGLTLQMLIDLGCTVVTNKDQAQLVIIGRGALSNDLVSMKSYEDFVRKGGRLLVMGQNRSTWESMTDLRLAPIASRQIFALDGGHPVMEGLVDQDLSDWRGSSSVNPAFPIAVDFARTGMPTVGWHWGNRGVVCSAGIEIPHRSGMRPVLVGEFDWQYSPLLELNFGAGLVVINQLDVEDHYQIDPAAFRVMGNIIDYAANVPIVPRIQAAYIGCDEDAEFLTELGLNYRRITQIGEQDQFVIIGRGANVDARQVAANRNILVLAQDESTKSGVAIRQEPHFGKAFPPDWLECRGVTPPRVRTKVDLPWAVIAPGKDYELGAAGLCALYKHPIQGTVVWCQADPRKLDVVSQPWLRRTRWHQTAFIVQLAANLGASFTADGCLFADVRQRPPLRISLAGEWGALLTNPLVAAVDFSQRHEDPGISNLGRKALQGDAEFTPVQVPGQWEGYGGKWENCDGEGVFIRQVSFPKEWRGRDLTLSLGTLDDNDTCMVNGVVIGTDQNGWNKPRVYTVPAALTLSGDITVTIRIWDWYGGGGFTGASDQIFIEPVGVEAPPGPYHADYNDEFPEGDNPFRYERW